MPTPAGPGHPDVEAAIDALYQVPLDQFTAERNALAASLRRAGHKAAADRVKALAKPSTTAWAVNQVWWRHRDRVQAMLDAGAAQRSAHLAWARGLTADVRDAGDARGHAVRDVTDAALEVLGGKKAVAPDVQYRISGTVEALASSGVPEGVVPGRLTTDLQSSGLDALSALAAAAGPSAGPTIVARRTPSPAGAGLTRPPVPAAGARVSQEAEAQARADALASVLAGATRVAEEAASAEARARSALDQATTRRAALEASLDDARAAEAAARRELSQATAATSRAELDRARAARDATRAREALEQLRKGT